MPHNALEGLRASQSGPFRAAGLAERGRKRSMKWTEEADKRWRQSMFGTPGGFGGNTVLTNRPSFGSTLEAQGNANWAPMFEALQELGEQTGKNVDIETPGLRDAPVEGSVPASLQGLQGAEYAYTPGGRPVAVRFRRR